MAKPDPIARFKETADLFQKAVLDQAILKALEDAANGAIQALQQGGKVLICGNGGSASQATHFAGELVGPFLDRERKGLAAIPLGFDPGSATAVSNDFGFAQIFSRQIEALGQAGDVLWALSTSGNSENILAAMKQAKAQQIQTVLFTNHEGGKAKAHADLILNTPESITPRVQELHLAYGHWLCEAIEAEMK